MILSKYDKILIFVNDGGMYVGVILFTSTLNFVQRIKIKKKISHGYYYTAIRTAKIKKTIPKVGEDAEQLELRYHVERTVKPYNHFGK